MFKKRILNLAGAILLVAFLTGGLYFLYLPKGPRELMPFDDPWNQERQMVTANDYVVVTGTPWATQAAVDVLEKGGNAFDAAVAALLMLNVTFGEAASFPGIAPLILYDASQGVVRSYVGVGTAPAKATIEFFHAQGYETVPDLDILAQLIPASPDVIISLLTEYGTLSFSELSAPAIEMAREGFPVHTIMARNLDFSLLERIGFAFLMPYNTKVYLRGEWWRPLYYRDRFIRPDLAGTLEAMGKAEQDVLAAGGTREDALRAVRDYFYRGPITELIIELHEEENGLFTREDLYAYQGYWEEPLQGSYGEYTFYTNGTWTQGIVVLMTMQILENFDLLSMEHNSELYVHTIVQAIELCMADREAYVGDPNFVNVALDRLLSKDYAIERSTRIQADAFEGMPEAGELTVSQSGVYSQPSELTGSLLSELLNDAPIGKDTSHLAIIDSLGNSITITPSDFPKSPMVPGTGLTLGNRMTQFRLIPGHPNALAPGKRPRVTPHAVIVFKDGEFFMSYGTPGGDMQAQALVQVFLNMAVFGMDAQEAIDAPRFRTLNFPDSFAPHEAYPATLDLEASLFDVLKESLEMRGYTVNQYPDWDNHFGGVGVVIFDGEHLLAGSDPREGAWAMGR
ncbi:MAG: gamma-glutamyltransferase [Anaerolineaceae bacterium]|nr:gamma-glutamyltransferase [Anaerolineaceae bacterium]